VQLLREEGVVLDAVLVLSDGVAGGSEVLAAIVDDEFELVARFDCDVRLEAVGLVIVAARDPLLPGLSGELSEHFHAPPRLGLLLMLPDLQVHSSLEAAFLPELPGRSLGQDLLEGAMEGGPSLAGVVADPLLDDVLELAIEPENVDDPAPGLQGVGRIAPEDAARVGLRLARWYGRMFGWRDARPTSVIASGISWRLSIGTSAQEFTM